MQCPRCNEEEEQDGNFCSNCGNKLREKCKKCGKMEKMEWIGRAICETDLENAQETLAGYKYEEKYIPLIMLTSAVIYLLLSFLGIYVVLPVVRRSATFSFGVVTIVGVVSGLLSILCAVKVYHFLETKGSKKREQELFQKPELAEYAEILRKAETIKKNSG